MLKNFEHTYSDLFCSPPSNIGFTIAVVLSILPSGRTIMRVLSSRSRFGKRVPDLDENSQQGNHIKRVSLQMGVS